MYEHFHATLLLLFDFVFSGSCSRSIQSSLMVVRHCRSIRRAQKRRWRTNRDNHRHKYTPFTRSLARRPHIRLTSIYCYMWNAVYNPDSIYISKFFHVALLNCCLWSLSLFFFNSFIFLSPFIVSAFHVYWKTACLHTLHFLPTYFSRDTQTKQTSR